MTGLDFCRIHSAYLVNLEKIDRIDGGKQLLIKGRSLPVAQTRAAAFKEAYMRYTRRAVK